MHKCIGRISMWRQSILLTVLLLFGLSACQETIAPVETEIPALTASGFIEAEEIGVAPEVGGRVVEILAEVGDEVQAGDVLVKLDDRVAQAQVTMAEAKVAEARAKLKLAEDFVTDAELRKAEAMLDQARAARIGACQAVSDTAAILENPQALDRQIAVAQAQVRAAEAGHMTASAFKDAAEIANDNFYDAQEALQDVPTKVEVYNGSISGAPLDLPPEILDFINDNPPPSGTYRFGNMEIVIEGSNMTVFYFPNPTLPVGAHFIPNQYWQAWVGVNSAQAAYDGLRNVLWLLYQVRDHPTQILAQLDTSIAQCQQAHAQENMADAQLTGLRKGAAPEDIAVLEALYQQVQAELTQAQVALNKQTLTAVSDGIILERTLEPGELAAPNMTLLVLADLDMVYVTLYLPNRDLSRIALGQAVEVRVDTFPDRVFQGEVAYISQEAEFPPQQVPQPEDRVTLIFAVRVRVENIEHLLKPGVLAEATFEE